MCVFGFTHTHTHTDTQTHTHIHFFAAGCSWMLARFLPLLQSVTAWSIAVNMAYTHGTNHTGEAVCVSIAGSVCKGAVWGRQCEVERRLHIITLAPGMVSSSF